MDRLYSLAFDLHYWIFFVAHGHVFCLLVMPINYRTHMSPNNGEKLVEINDILLAFC